MINSIKKFLVSSPLFPILRFLKQRRELYRWEKGGTRIPLPELMKHEIIRGYGKQFNLETFVETGTYLGSTIFAMRQYFREIVSIELNQLLYKQAKRRFARYDNIRIMQGDSGDVLCSFLRDLEKGRRVLFWLDAHFCGGITGTAPLHVPVLRELECILRYQPANCVILIDDARMFTGRDGYPAIEEIFSIVSLKRPSYTVSLDKDIIRIHNSNLR